MTGWYRERSLLLLMLSVGLSGLWWSPWPFLPLAVIALMLLAWQLRQTFRFKHWLATYERNDAPDMSGLWRDITRLALRPTKRSQRYRHRLQAVTDRLQDSTSALEEAVIMVDRHGNLEWWNRAASRFLGLRPVDENQPLTNLIRAPEFTEYLLRREFDQPLIMPAPANKERWLEIKVTPFGRNDRLLILHDVTRLRQLEDMRKDFVANVSHELRTPLTVIRGYLETLEDVSDMLPHAALRMVSQMQEQAIRMESLVRDLLLLSRLDTPNHDTHHMVPVGSLLQQIVSEANAVSAGQHNIQLSIETKATLNGCDQELRSAFTNLIINAVKYTPEGGDVRIRWYEHGGQGRLAVEDSGIGIEAHHLPRLTERFYRADPSRSKSTGGTGLGLAIVKHVLLRHRARLEVQSTPGEGSCFTAIFDDLAYPCDKAG